ncbi:MAG: hypothetical protein BJ554DRAFT_71 [Olpidium bornovanus]|uniref:non-specific serine/threonine protein kinase n=1 Tax=Olpidium bornovanus TaxID=278681 RepID=A0A8H8DIH8_9FUNG|nr:MAG: hypothetical protein BJ554DRAFT_71 [Olpidium bornovanus]
MQEIEEYHNLLRPAQKIRVGRFAFTVDTTSAEAPSTVFSEIHRALVDLQKTTYPTLRFERTNPAYYRFTCRFSKTGAEVPPASPALFPSQGGGAAVAAAAAAASAASERGAREEADTLCAPSTNQSWFSGASRGAPAPPSPGGGGGGGTTPGVTANILPITAQPEDDVVFEVEVCKLWLLKLHGIRIKRKWGSVFLYKEIYSMLIERIHL